MKRLRVEQYASILYEVTTGRTGESLTAATNAFFALLQKQGSLSKLPKIIDAFVTYAESKAGKRNIHITAARELSDRMTTVIAKQFGDQVFVDSAIDPALIGGVTVRDGFTVIDASVRMQVKRLEHTLLTHTS